MNNTKQGSIAVLILWVIFFFPIAIWYWFSRLWPKEMFQNVVPQNEITRAQTKNKVNEDEKNNKVEKNKGVE